MTLQSPFHTVIYDKDFNVSGFLVDAIYENWVPAWSDNPYGNFSVAADNPHAAALEAPGARVTVMYKGEVVVSGPIESRQGDALDFGVVTYQVLGDKSILEDILWLTNPGQPLQPESTSALGQAWATGPQTAGTVANQYAYYQWPANVVTAETAIKHAIKVQMIDRLGLPITIAPDLGRGGNVVDSLPKVRMAPLKEVMTPILGAANIPMSIRFWQDEYGSTINVDVVTGGSWPQPLTPESGIITEGSYEVAAPAATRAIVGGSGETAARVFYGQEGAGWQTDLERTWHRVREVFREAQGGSDLVWPDGTADDHKVAKYYKYVAAPADWTSYLKTLMTEAANGLLDGAPTSTLAMTLAESETFTFGGTDGVRVGDTVTVVIRDQVFSDVIARAYLTFTRDNGVRIQPEIGQHQNDPDVQLAQFVTRLSAALTSLHASK